MAKRRPFSDREKRSIRSLLEKCLGPEYLSVRSGIGNTRLTYVEGWVTISLANRIFGFDGWSSRIKEFTQEYCDVGGDGKVSVGYSCCCQVMLRDGTYKEDVGFGSADNQKMKSLAVEKAKKEAATDALKRALRLFGNALGNCVYNKSFLENVKHVHKSKKREFDTKDLLTRKDFNLPTGSQVKESPSFDNDIFDISNMAEDDAQL